MAVLATALALAPAASAAEPDGSPPATPGPSLEGYTGQLATPSAWIQATGTARLLVSDAADPRFPSIMRYTATVGVFRYLEIAGRLTNGSDIRDLSANFKLQAPLDLLWPHVPVALAIGGQDLGGAASHFRAGFAVASARAGPLEASLGWGLGPDRLDGVFAGGALRIVEGLDLLADWDAADAHAGVRLSLPLDRIGLPLRVGGMASSTLTHHPGTIAWAATLDFPLWMSAGPRGRTPPPGAPARPSEPVTPPETAPPVTPVTERAPLERGPPPTDVAAARTDAGASATAGPADAARVALSALVAGGVSSGAAGDASPRSPAPASAPPPVPQLPPRPEPPGPGAVPTTEALARLEDALVALGFEEVHAGSRGDLVVVEYENDRYNRDQADGLAVVLGEVEKAALPAREVAIVLERSGLRLVEVAFPRDPRAGAFRWSGAAPRWTWNPPERDVAWASRGARNLRILHSQLVLSPGLRTWVGTEIGAFDWVLSFQPDLIVPLWPGAIAFARGDVPFAWSANLRDGALLRPYRDDPRLQYALGQQAFALARGLMAMVSAGVFRTTDAGGLGELLWAIGDGAVALGAQGSWTANSAGDQHWAATGSARWLFAPLDSLASVRGGRFVQGDTGVRAELSRWFGDTQIGVFFAHTDLSPNVSTAGAFITLPLSPRRDMRPGWLQVRGPRRWAYELGTVVGEQRNPIVAGQAVPPLAPWNLEAEYLDQGRVSRAGLVEVLPPMWRPEGRR